MNPHPPTYNPRRSGPPKYTPIPRNFDQTWHADPFDPRFRRKDQAIVDLNWTPLGILVQIAGWCRDHTTLLEKCPEFRPIYNSVIECLEREAPDTLKPLIGEHAKP